MDDLISRQAAIEALNINRNPVFHDSVDYEGAMHDICKLPSTQSEPQWIPCSERLPKDYEDVLVWFEYFRYGIYNRLYQTHGIGDYSSKSDAWIINHETGWHKLRVLAWMPLPKPYKEGNNE